MRLTGLFLGIQRILFFHCGAACTCNLSKAFSSFLFFPSCNCYLGPVVPPVAQVTYLIIVSFIGLIVMAIFYMAGATTRPGFLRAEQ